LTNRPQFGFELASDWMILVNLARYWRSVAKISNLELIVFSKENILTLDIPVSNSPNVHRIQTVYELFKELHRNALWKLLSRYLRHEIEKCFLLR